MKQIAVLALLCLGNLSFAHNPHYLQCCGAPVKSCTVSVDATDEAFTGVFYQVDQEIMNCRGTVIRQKVLARGLSIEVANELTLSNPNCF